MRKTTVIAELGSCHDGDLLRLLDMIVQSKVCGANVVKMQWLSSAERLVERRNAPEYLRHYLLIAHPLDWLRNAQGMAKDRGLDLHCAVYLPEDVNTVAPYVDAIKIASFEARDATLFATAQATGKPVLISTGMQNHEESRILASRLRVGDTILHCVSAYPTPLDQANLRAIRQLGHFIPPGAHVGWSDHTPPADGSIAGAVAVALGADTVEVHVRHSLTSALNPDISVARSWLQLAQYIRHIREAEKLISDLGIKRVQEVEQPMLRYRAR